MVETWIYVIGGLIAAVIAFVIAYNLISSSIEYAQRQNALTQFSGFCTDVNTVCLQELTNSVGRKFSIPLSVRVVYATDDTNNALPKVVDQIKNQELNSGQNICMQFKDEQILRCCPEPPEKSFCSITMPYVGALPESEDIWLRVRAILGGPPLREYQFCVKKTGFGTVNISFDMEECNLTPATQTQSTSTTTPLIV